MLILTRRSREAIIIDECVRIEVLSWGNRFATLGIAAPKDIAIYREEYFEELLRKGLVERRW